MRSQTGNVFFLSKSLTSQHPQDIYFNLDRTFVQKILNEFLLFFVHEKLLIFEPDLSINFCVQLKFDYI